MGTRRSSVQRTRPYKRSVECIFNPDEVVNQSRYGALPLSYGAAIASRAGGTRTHNPRVTNHVLQSAVGHVLAATKFGQSYPLPSERRLPETSVSGGDRNRTMYSEPAVAVVSKMPNEGLPRVCFRYGRPYQRPGRQLLTGPFVSERLQRRSLAGRPASLP